jgi:hypothetical protein
VRQARLATFQWGAPPGPAHGVKRPVREAVDGELRWKKAGECSGLPLMGETAGEGVGQWGELGRAVLETEGRAVACP